VNEEGAVDVVLSSKVDYIDPGIFALSSKASQTQDTVPDTRVMECAPRAHFQELLCCLNVK